MEVGGIQIWKVGRLFQQLRPTALQIRTCAWSSVRSSTLCVMCRTTVTACCCFYTAVFSVDCGPAVHEVDWKNALAIPEGTGRPFITDLFLIISVTEHSGCFHIVACFPFRGAMMQPRLPSQCCTWSHHCCHDTTHATARTSRTRVVLCRCQVSRT